MGAGSEAIGGMFLLLGLSTRPASFLIACTMLVAIFFQKWEEGLWNMLPALGFLWVALYNLILGGGKWSLDYLIVKYASKLFASKNMTVAIAACFLLSTPILVNAQIEGKGNSTETIYSIGNIDKLDLGLNADYTIVKSEKTYLKISAQENILAYIERTEKNGQLTLDQKEWIQPTLPIQITIGMPKTNKISLSSWSEVQALELDEENLIISASVGSFILKGKVTKLNINSGQSKIDASDLLVKIADVKTTGDAQISLNVEEQANLNLDVQKIKLTWIRKPGIINGAYPGDKVSVGYNKYFDTRYIDFSIKNNSSNRNNFFVEGPKPDQSSFSYGFPMMPGQKRKERWTVGTKIYKVSNGGSKKLVCTIEESDENKIVELFR
jgi:hypothetical protein